jgi:hypothetical protein
MQTNKSFIPSEYLAFQAERRIGQDESASSLMWTALYDLLLEWVDPANCNLHRAEVDLNYDQDDIGSTVLLLQLRSINCLMKC